ncbi:MAG: hypothetical protein CMF38_04220 [Legionellaceae bacterium]|nr:hypothetical protein [Legionellaceae bacterium]HAF87106.1 hypothetical protein [Legionellales bacterium]HCA88961.1 hypothetical protein [Legionellales bacterium]|tara:strand:- start:3986 stop:5389 length:1404 start_codon:yes stop_codon:yes gene_type:complete
MSEQTVWVVNNIAQETSCPLTMKHVDTIDKLPLTAPSAIILSKNNHQDWLDLLMELRRRKAYRFTPVFYHGYITMNLRHLFDGSDQDDILQISQDIYKKLDRVAENQAFGSEEERILLTYLYTRQQSVLKGNITESAYVFDYPLLRVLLPNFPIEESTALLQDFVLRNLLIEQELVNEIQTCHACHSGLLNFKNRCPNCKAIDIKPQKFVHCFACGAIAPVSTLLRQERLICSSCHIRLHDLGIDYELPKENKLCKACGYFFDEPFVEIMCVSCEANFAMDDLNSRRLYNYCITKRAEHLIQGIETSVFRSFNELFKTLDYMTFMSIIGWQMTLVERYGRVYFSLMTLQITNITELIDTTGKAKTESLIGQLFTHLHQVFRASDLSARLDGVLFFFLPMTVQDGCLIILNRIRESLKTLTQEKLDRNITLSASYMTSSDMVQAGLKNQIKPQQLQELLIQSNVCVLC